MRQRSSPCASSEALFLLSQVVWANEDHSWNDFQDALVLVTVKRRVDEALLATLPRLRLVAVAFTGYDHVDLEACERRRVKVANVPGYSTDGVRGSKS